MTDFYSQNRCVCSTRSHGPLLCAFCLSFHFKLSAIPCYDLSALQSSRQKPLCGDHSAFGCRGPR